MSLIEKTKQAFEIGMKQGWLNEASESQLGYSQTVATSIERVASLQNPNDASNFELKADAGKYKPIRTNGGQLLVEADTGVGKTLGYLIPTLLYAAETKTRVVVSTFTVALQKQLLKTSDEIGDGGDVQKAIAVVEKMTGVKLTAAARLGKRHYAHPDRIKNMYDKFKLNVKKEGNTDRYEHWEIFSDWLQTTQTGILGEFLEENGTEFYPDMLEMELFSQEHEKENGVWYANAIANALNADVIIVNHAMLAIAALTCKNNEPFLLQDCGDERTISSLIVDECDKLPDAARSISTVLIPWNDFNRDIINFLDALEVKNASEHTLVNQVESFASNLILKCPENWDEKSAPYLFWDDLSVSSKRDLTDKLQNLKFVFKELMPKISDSDKSNNPKIPSLERKITRHLSNVSNYIARITGSDEDAKSNYVAALQWSPTRHFPSLALFQMYPARILKNLWAYCESHFNNLILTSATISCDWDPNFRSMEIELGIFDAKNPCNDLYDRFSPQEFGRVSFVLPDPSVPKPIKSISSNDSDIDDRGFEVNKIWVAYAVKAFKNIIIEGGRTLVLSTSYSTADALKNALIAEGVDMSSILFKSKKMRMQEAIDFVKYKTNGILVTPSGWEGLDARSHGFSWNHVAVLQLPYPPKNGALQKALFNRLIKRGKTEEEANACVFGNAENEMLRKLRQGFGRGIRKYDDEFTFWMLDPRFPVPSSFKLHLNEAVQRTVSRAVQAIPHRFTRGSSSGSALQKRSRVLLEDGTFWSKY